MKTQQQPLDPYYLVTDEKELLEKIAARKKELADDLLILCHHYQQEAVYRFADVTGDSLKLARQAALSDRKHIVFCGVHFMAESSDILTADDQLVILPDLRAGCPMADMAALDDALWAWEEINGVSAGQTTVPITYVNSSAAIKAFVGRNNGSVCTSSNAEKVLPWAFERGDKVLFLPDEHLGRNSALALGIKPNQIIVWQRGKPMGGNTPEAVRQARVILWNGSCTVHMQFSKKHIRMWREKDKKINIIVHPECRHEVVAAADFYGSTERIITTITKAPSGSHWAVGTEINLVNRLKRNNPDKEVHSLSPFQCLCSTMYRIKPGYLLWVLDNLSQGRVVNRITVEKQTAIQAKTALDRMLSI